MKKVKIAELKDRLSEHLRLVEKGSEVIVTDRDRPIARIVPFESAPRPVRWIRASGDFQRIRTRRYPPAGWKIDSTQLLREDRIKR